ncbi:hypothetical protein FWH09_00195 [Candidatus Saccharibacteria bacterium]|nr:hypothetical protein [Candidatus Saccharibacteria bacterium]
MKKILFIALLALGLATVATPAHAINSPVCENIRNSPAYADNQESLEAALRAAGCDDQENLRDSPMVATTMGIIFFVIGIISVIVLIYGGIRYMLAQGLAAELSVAQHTIIYGVVGLIISLAGWAIVQFVFTRVFGS